ncbi:nitroreductase family protein [Blastopirellula retiformator]|uniref:Putative NAD(P)H nitroreductase YodC n=1 Tax=Blastopirellula retiformator TaxID=2527970 RepID=A0A5C5V2C4_9BACT|nr:nitroreductase family protein [Blastopirellula retiformator]TWT31872.1 putative NAD(P)H nitroreductase YodC [Blastopirellula retiformator]
MDTFDAIYQRRSIKHYDPTHEMSDEEIRKLMDAALQSPTSFNMQNWRFVVVRDKAVRQQLRAAAYGQAQVEEASIVVVLCAHLRAHALEPERYWRNSPPDVGKKLAGMLFNLYEGNEQLQRDEAMRSVGIAGQTIMLAAKAMGYDSCPMVGYDPAKVAEVIRLPEDHVLGYMITVGKAVTPAWPKPGQLEADEVVIRDQFS